MRLSQETDEDHPLDDDSQQAVEAMMQLSKSTVPPKARDDSHRYQQPQGGPSTSAQTIHDDLEVSDSENEDTRHSEDEGGLWF